jgi:hypothetical protein
VRWQGRALAGRAFGGGVGGRHSGGGDVVGDLESNRPELGKWRMVGSAANIIFSVRVG